MFPNRAKITKFGVSLIIFYAIATPKKVKRLISGMTKTVVPCGLRQHLTTIAMQSGGGLSVIE